MTKDMMAKYARLIAETGANVQKDQPVILTVAVDQHEFATMVVKECYRLGASWVRVDWTCQEQTKLHYQYKSLETLSKVTYGEEGNLKQMAEELPCRILILSEDPDGLFGVDQQKVSAAQQARFPVIKPYRQAIENRCQWTIAAVPSPAWACKVFPDDDETTAIEKLWDAILMTCHVTEDNDPAEAWRKHNEHFNARSAWLNRQHFDTITYKSSNGTDFTAGLIPEGVWNGGGESSLSGVFYNPNLPTEEIFTSPMRGKAEGTLVSTKPLSYQNQLIDRFSITFENGKAVSWNAEVGMDALTHMLTMDEGAGYLGELALVPCDSPINNTGVLFYNTLFDENASCHVALGRGFNDCIEGYKEKTDDECKALGINDSMIHVDFMIGAPDLCITGWKNGIPTPIFINGEWAF